MPLEIPRYFFVLPNWTAVPLRLSVFNFSKKNTVGLTICRHRVLQTISRSRPTCSQSASLQSLSLMEVGGMTDRQTDVSDKCVFAA